MLSQYLLCSGTPLLRVLSGGEALILPVYPISSSFLLLIGKLCFVTLKQEDRKGTKPALIEIPAWGDTLSSQNMLGFLELRQELLG